MDIVVPRRVRAMGRNEGGEKRKQKKKKLLYLALWSSIYQTNSLVKTHFKSGFKKAVEKYRALSVQKANILMENKIH